MKIRAQLEIACVRFALVLVPNSAINLPPEETDSIKIASA
jgi:hypothetical protein